MGRPGTDLEGQAGRVDGDRRRLGGRIRSGRPAFAVDLDRLELPAAPLAGRVAAGLQPDVARVAAVDPHSAMIAGIAALHAAETEDARQALELAGAEAAGSAGPSRVTHVAAHAGSPARRRARRRSRHRTRRRLPCRHPSHKAASPRRRCGRLIEHDHQPDRSAHDRSGTRRAGRRARSRPASPNAGVAVPAPAAPGPEPPLEHRLAASRQDYHAGWSLPAGSGGGASGRCRGGRTRAQAEASVCRFEMADPRERRGRAGPVPNAFSGWRRSWPSSPSQESRSAPRAGRIRSSCHSRLPTSTKWPSSPFSCSPGRWVSSSARTGIRYGSSTRTGRCRSRSRSRACHGRPERSSFSSRSWCWPS